MSMTLFIVAIKEEEATFLISYRRFNEWIYRYPFFNELLKEKYQQFPTILHHKLRICECMGGAEMELIS